MDKKLKKKAKILGEVIVPGDKSLSHRALIFGAISHGESRISQILRGADVMSTKSCLESMGASIIDNGEEMIVRGQGIKGLKRAPSKLDCGNSGTTMRLLMGLLSGLPFDSTLIGDVSLSKRPMKRVSDPLSQMGAHFELTNEKFPPVFIHGTQLKATHYELPLASAQVKSAMLIAGLLAKGKTKLTGKIQSRDHTERLLPHFGVKLHLSENEISIEGGQQLKGNDVLIPGDISSAAFFMVAALLCPGSEVHFKNLSLNPSRMGIVNLLKRIGADISIKITQEVPEPIGELVIKYSKLKSFHIQESEVASLIDEIPVLAVLATVCEGVSRVSGAEDLRAKESDRIEAVAQNLRAMGVKVDTYEDGFSIEGGQELHGAEIETFHDHRIAMAFSVASLIAEGETVIKKSEIVDISFPDFYKTLERIAE